MGVRFIAITIFCIAIISSPLYPRFHKQTAKNHNSEKKTVNDATVLQKDYKSAEKISSSKSNEVNNVKHTVIEPDIKPIILQDANFAQLALPIGKFTKSTVRCFFKHFFSRDGYAEELLPYTFAHMIEFLQYGINSDLDISFATSTLRLFTNRAKSCDYVTPEAIEPLIDRLPPILEAYSMQQPSMPFSDLKGDIKETLYSSFLGNFEQFKQRPESFFEELSNKLTNYLQDSNVIEKTLEFEQLRQIFIRFLETVLNKSMWTPFDKDEVWISVKRISIKLQKLYETDIITMDELDDFYQSLLARFILFLKMAGTDLPISTIQLIKEDIRSQSLLLLALEEQEDAIIPKADRLSRAVEQVEIKVIAKTHGVIS